MIPELELHAYVDNELADAEHNQITALALASPAILSKLNELQHLKALVCSAYSQIDPDTRTRTEVTVRH